MLVRPEGYWSKNRSGAWTLETPGKGSSSGGPGIDFSKQFAPRVGDRPMTAAERFSDAKVNAAFEKRAIEALQRDWVAAGETDENGYPTRIAETYQPTRDEIIKKKIELHRQEYDEMDRYNGKSQPPTRQQLMNEVRESIRKENPGYVPPATQQAPVQPPVDEPRGTLSEVIVRPPARVVTPTQTSELETTGELPTQRVSQQRYDQIQRAMDELPQFQGKKVSDFITPEVLNYLREQGVEDPETHAVARFAKNLQAISGAIREGGLDMKNVQGMAKDRGTQEAASRLANLPRPKSPEERDRIVEPGQWYIAPNGALKQREEKPQR